MSKKKEQEIKSTLRENGYTEQTADEIWKWYTCPTYPLKKQTSNV